MDKSQNIQERYFRIKDQLIENALAADEEEETEVRISVERRDV